MKDAKHTSGPWQAVANGGDDPDPRQRIVIADNGGDSQSVCKVYDPYGNGELEANARLIADAPEMRAVLEAIYAYLPYLPSDCSVEGTPLMGRINKLLGK